MKLILIEEQWEGQNRKTASGVRCGDVRVVLCRGWFAYSVLLLEFGVYIHWRIENHLIPGAIIDSTWHMGYIIYLSCAWVA